MSHQEVLGGIIRGEISKERVEKVDLSYLGRIIDQCWMTNFEAASLGDLQKIVLESISEQHLTLIKSIGEHESKLSALLLEYTFSLSDRTLALLVHEAFARIAGIVDIKYPYEEHKELFPKASTEAVSDWGKGYGMIRPHSDDLYEDRDINIMSLTVAKDTSHTSTWFWPVKDVLKCLSDEELGRLALSEATFYSGTNVEGIRLSKKKPVLRRDDYEGLGFRLDFRIDDSIGPRMQFEDEEMEAIFAKLRAGLRTLRPLASNPSTGSVSILSNFKVLHGRSALNPIMLYDGESSRILYRSKGIK